MLVRNEFRKNMSVQGEENINSLRDKSNLLILVLSKELATIWFSESKSKLSFIKWLFEKSWITAVYWWRRSFRWRRIKKMNI